MKIDRNLYQIRAEVLLNYLYPELEHEWMVHGKGTFYRNYNQDILSLDVEGKTVELARDGFLKLLPEGVFARNEELLGEDSSEKLKDLEWRMELLNEAFSPFDTYVFHKKLTIERYTSELLDQKLEYLLKKYFDFDLTAEPNDLVREAAVLLPFVCRLRGDFGFVSSLLGVLMNCQVEMSVERYSHLDSTICWLPKVKYALIIPGLTAAEYREKIENLKPLVDFMREWLIPFDVLIEVNVREYLVPATDPDRITLNYNTALSYQSIEQNQ